MKRKQMFGVAAFVAALTAGGCAGTGGTSSTFGLPAASSMRDSIGGSPHGTITEYAIPHPLKDVPKAFPVGITTGPDGALWFAERGAGKIGRITTAGDITAQFRIGGKARFPFFLATGPDGNLWATGGSIRTYRQESHGTPDPYGAIIRMTTAGVVTHFDLPTMNSDARQIAQGPDGNLWFTESRGAIGRITTAGDLTEFPTPHGNAAFGIAVGPDGAIWFCELNNNKLVRMSTSGKITDTFTVRSAGGVTSGPDGNLWVTEIFRRNQVARVTTSGEITEFKLSPGSIPKNDAVGADGHIYIAEFNAGKIAEVTPGGTIIEHDIPTPKSGPWGITSAPDGNIWFTESLTGKIGKLSV